MHQHPKIPGHAARRTWSDSPGTYVVTALWLGATLWLGVMLVTIAVELGRSPSPAEPTHTVLQPRRLILDAFLVQTRDAEGIAPCWLDP